jgi:hypothetical protein
MPQLILNADALRVSVRMRKGFGWYPTEKDNESQLKLFEASVLRLKHSLEDKEGPVTPNNMRKSLKTLHEICHQEADALWDHVTSSESDDFKDVLDSHESCVSYAYALAFAIEACFDDYLRKKRQEKFDAVEREMNQGHEVYENEMGQMGSMGPMGPMGPRRSRSRGPPGPPHMYMGVRETPYSRQQYKEDYYCEPPVPPAITRINNRSPHPFHGGRGQQTRRY